MEITKTELERSLHTYFAGVSHSLELTERGKMIVVNVNYENFKPKHEVYEHIARLGSNVDVCEINRSYNANAIELAATEVCDGDMEPELYMKNAAGDIVRVSMLSVVDYILHNKTLTA